MKAAPEMPVPERLAVCPRYSVRDRCRPLDQDDFWLNQPKILNLIAFKVVEQLYGFN
jgi:hypothetical protein